MRLRDLRRVLMNCVMGTLKKEGPCTHETLLCFVAPACTGIGRGTLSAALTARLEELIERKFVQITPRHHTDGVLTFYEPHDRMFDPMGNYIGNTLIDPEWPDDWRRKK